MKAILEKLSAIQAELKVPKNQYNSFGKYSYRSCEDILEAAKPVCKAHGCVLTVGDDLVCQGNRFYIRATATLYDIESGESVTNTALARESETKKGMDDSQITGTASSYARKYALGGLFNLDDTKDADTDEYKNAADGRSKKQQSKQEPNPIYCIHCNAEIKAFNGKEGVLTPEQFAEKSGGFCLECYKRQKQ